MTDYKASKRIVGTSAERLGLAEKLSLSSSGVSKSNCKTYYNFEQTSGDLVNQATTSNGYTNGTGSSGDCSDVDGVTRNQTGAVSKAWSLSGSDSYIFSPQAISNSTYSVCAWVYPTTISGNQSIICDDASNGGGSSTQLNLKSSGKFAIENYTNDWYALESTTVATANNWYHVAVTFTTSERKMYVNGVLENTGTGYSVTNAAGTRIGADGYGGGIIQEFTGKLDEFSYWDKVLSASDILTIAGTPNVQTNSIFEETDTGKHYIWSGSAWTEVA